MPFIRLATNFVTSWLISAIAGKKIDDVQSGFRYVSLRALKNINLETKNFDTEPEILLKASWLNYIIIIAVFSRTVSLNFFLSFDGIFFAPADNKSIQIFCRNSP